MKPWKIAWILSRSAKLGLEEVEYLLASSTWMGSLYLYSTVIRQLARRSSSVNGLTRIKLNDYALSLLSTGLSLSLCSQGRAFWRVSKYDRDK